MPIFDAHTVSMFNTRFLRGGELSVPNNRKIKFTDLMFGELRLLGIIRIHYHYHDFLSDNSIRTVPKPDVNYQNTKKK